MGLRDLFGQQYYEIKLEEHPTPFRDEGDFLGSLVALRVAMQKLGCSEEEIKQARKEIFENARKAHPEWGWRSVER